MRRYLLDTTVLAAYLLARPGAAQLITPWLNPFSIATSILCYGEVVEYIKSSPDYPARLIQLQELLSDVYPFFLTYPILERYADIRRELRAKGQLIGDVDTLIAATGLEHDLTVVTTDAHDFQRVSGLSVMATTSQELRHGQR